MMNLGNTLAAPAPPAPDRPRQLCLRVAAGPDAGREVISDGRERSIGTAPDNDLVLTDPTVSRHHLAVRCTERGHWVRDLGSISGVLVGPHLVQSAMVTHGCELTIGTTRLVVEQLDDEICGPAAAAPAAGALHGDRSEPVAGSAPAAGTEVVVTDEFDPALSFRDAKERAVARWERWYVARLLHYTRGNLSEAARVAHSDRSHLRKLVHKYLPPGAGGTDPAA
jgi:hypothetical protein